MSGRFLLDTNVPSETLRPMPDPRVSAWVEAHSDVQFVSVVSNRRTATGRNASGARFRPPPAVRALYPNQNSAFVREAHTSHYAGHSRALVAFWMPGDRRRDSP